MRARDNPFSTDRVLRLRYRLRHDSWHALTQRLAAMHYRGAIVGPEGSGKTTLLEDFEPRLRADGFEIVSLQLTREAPNFPPRVLRELSANVGPGHIILFDGAEQLSRWSWWGFLRKVRRAGGLLITSHRSDLLPTLIECRTDEALLTELIAELLQEPIEKRREQTATLFKKHGGNLRDALRELYDEWAERATGPAECPLPDEDRFRDRTAACLLAE